MNNLLLQCSVIGGEWEVSNTQNVVGMNLICFLFANCYQFTNQNVDSFPEGKGEVRRKKWEVILIQSTERRIRVGRGLCAEEYV